MENTSYISQEDRDLISYLRGFAILSIIFGHLGGYWAHKPHTSYLHLTGSTFFFFLAGGVLYHSYQRSTSNQQFYFRRFCNLLFPYYLLCLVALLIHLLRHQAFPAPDLANLFLWMAIRPRHELMPFPLGQLWFLHTYVMLMVFCPLIFNAYDRKRPLFFGVGAAFLILSVVKLFLDIRIAVPFLGWNLYNLCFYGTFFMTGIVFFSNKEGNVRRCAASLLAVAVVVRLSLCTADVAPDLTVYFLNKDILYIVPAAIFLSLVIIFKHWLYLAVKKVWGLEQVLFFFHKHCFSAYLLHSLCILISERLLHMLGFTGKSISLGVIKFVMVACTVAVLAIPFTELSKALSALALAKATDLGILRRPRVQAPEQQ